MSSDRKKRQRNIDVEIEQDREFFSESEREPTEHRSERPLEDSREKMTFDGRKLEEDDDEEDDE